MWFESLPPLIIIAVCSVVPCYASLLIKKYCWDNMPIRTFNSQLDYVGFARDFHQFRENSRIKGLDDIPDK